jgi:hypothetical protein
MHAYILICLQALCGESRQQTMCKVYNSLVNANYTERILLKKSRETEINKDRTLPVTTTM